MTQDERMARILGLLEDAGIEASRLGWAETGGDAWNIGGLFDQELSRVYGRLTRARQTYNDRKYEAA